MNCPKCQSDLVFSEDTVFDEERRGFFNWSAFKCRDCEYLDFSVEEVHPSRWNYWADGQEE